MSRLSHVNSGGCRAASTTVKNSVNGRITSGEGVNRIDGCGLEVASTAMKEAVDRPQQQRCQ